MKTVVILTFPTAQPVDEFELAGKTIKELYPEIEWILIDQCSGATVVQVPEQAKE